MEQLELIPETEEERAKRLGQAIDNHQRTLFFVKKNQASMDEHLRASLTDLEKGIERLNKKRIRIQAYLDTRLMLDKTQRILDSYIKRDTKIEKFR